MKSILERLELSDLFAYICPGVILITSLALWIEVDFGSSFWKQQVLVGIVILIVAYTLGLIVASLNYRAQVGYLGAAGRLPEHRAGRIWERVKSFFYPQPIRRFSPQMVRGIVRISNELERLSGQVGLSDLIDPWDWPVVYRTFMADRVGEENRSVLTEAETLRRRFLFAMGVSLALYLLGMQSLLRIFLYDVGAFVKSVRAFSESSFPSIGPLNLVVITVLGLWASYLLRQVAIRMWELERYLTASLAQPRPLE